MTLSFGVMYAGSGLAAYINIIPSGFFKRSGRCLTDRNMVSKSFILNSFLVGSWI
jgi:hypothetical protein